MAKRYTYSKTIKINGSDETFSAVEFDSFDEAIRAVEKGVYERKLQVEEEAKKTTGAAAIQGLGKKEEPDNKPEEVDDVEQFDTTNPLPGDDDEDED